MNSRRSQSNHDSIARHVILWTLMWSTSAWSRPAVTSVTSGPSDVNSYQESLSHRVHQRVNSSLWKSRIDALADKPSPDQSELQDLIRRLNAVQVKPPAPKTDLEKPLVVLPPVVNPAPVQDNNNPEVNQPAAQVPVTPQGPLSAATLKAIAQVQEANEQVDNPLALAEMLYTHGYRSQSLLFYQQALRQADPNDPLDKAWVLLQLGNCYKDDDPVEAKRYYSQVVADYAKSPWTALAKIQLALVQLYIDNRPQELLHDSLNPPAEPAGP